MYSTTELAFHNRSIMDWAKLYASFNIPIIPIHEPSINGKCSCKNTNCSSIAKHPRVRHGLKDATTDSNTIQKWWMQWPNANIGIITGQISQLIVIDIDPKNGGLDSLSKIEQMFGLIVTAKVRTGGSGFHFYFSLPENIKIKNKVNLLPGVDIRAENGYIIAPPSQHLSLACYEWERIFSKRIQAPEWLLDLCSEKKKKKIFEYFDPDLPNNTSTRSPQIKNHVNEGNRNSFLTSLAGSMRKHRLGQQTIYTILSHINQITCNPSISSNEVLKIANSISNYEVSGESGLTWPENLPLLPRENKLPPMSTDLIPKNMQPWIVDIGTRMQIPLELVCIPAIVSLGSIIGRKIRIYPKRFDNWIVIPNLWGAIVARPGTLKSPAIAEAIKPLEALVEHEHRVFKAKSDSWEIQKSITTATIEAIKEQLLRALNKNNIKEAETLKEQLVKVQSENAKNTPLCKRFKTNDATIEKLVQLLIENTNGLLLVRDELSGWLATLNKAGREGEREFWLECWGSKGSYTVDRIGRGTVHVSSLCLSVFGAIQPDKLTTLLTNPLQSNDDGLLQRFQLIVCPDIKEKWENHDYKPNDEAYKTIENIFRKISSFNPSNHEEFLGVHFSLKAQEHFNSWREQLENKLRSKDLDNSPYEAHLSKYRSLIPALALIFEIIQSEALPQEVSHKSLSLALDWSEYLTAHAKKIYQVGYHPYQSSIETLIKKIQTKKILDGDTIRSITRHCWENLRNNEQIESALEFLSQLQWVKIIEKHSNGRPARIIKLHPSFLSTI